MATRPLRGSGKSDRKRVAKVPTGPLRGSGKSGRKIVARVTKLLRSGDKSGK